MRSKLEFLLVTLSLSILAPVGASACSSSNPSTPSSGTEVRKLIRAAEGGEVTDPKGEVALKIPAGALAQDTEIRLVVREPEAGSQSNVYDFGPDGTTFTRPASIAVKLAGAPPQDKKAVVAVYDGSKWTPLAGGGSDGATVTGNVEHFSKFAIVFVDGKVVASACADVVKNFTACGGNPQGTWKYRDVCADVTVGSGQNPFAQMCPDAKLEAEVTIDGTLTISATEISHGVLKTTSTSIMRIPPSCYGAFQASTCADVGTRLKLGSCAEESGTCVCKQTQTSDDPAATKPYTLEGNTIKSGDSANEYCVKGATLEIAETDAKTNKRQAVVVLEKQ
jgi:hypothetical protein